MTGADMLGWLASALVLATLCMHAMVPLRLMAFASNLAFVACGASAGINRVLMLHMGLLPPSGWRLAQGRGGRGVNWKGREGHTVGAT